MVIFITVVKNIRGSWGKELKIILSTNESEIVS
jgi:hypothetical protein